MVIKTMRFTRKTAVLLIIVLAVILSAIIILSGAGGDNKQSGGTVRSNDERVKYLSKLGWEVDADSVDKKDVIIPQSFDEVFTAYNDLQLQQGFDLSAYFGKQVSVYTYEVTNYPVECEVYAVIYISGGHVVGGDIHSAAVDGFMHGLIRK